MTDKQLWQKPRWRTRMTALIILSLMATSGAAHAQGKGRTVAALGRIVPGNGVVHVAAPSGETGQAIVAELRVLPGSRINEGGMIAVLASKPMLRAAVTSAEKEFLAAEAVVTIAKNQAALLDKQIEAAGAQIAVAKQQATSATAAVGQAQAAVTQANTEYNAALERLQGESAEHARVLKEWDPGTRDREEIKFQQNVLALEMDKLTKTQPAQISVLNAATKAADSEAATATAQVAVAEAQQATLVAQKDIALAQVAQAEAQVERATAGAAQAKARLEQSVVSAPISGIVLSVNAWPGEAVGQYGVVTLADTKDMFVEAEVYVDDIVHIEKNQTVTISGQPLSEALTGKVDRVDQQIAPNALFSRDPTAFADRRVVMVRVKFDDPEPVRALIGAQVTVKIDADSNPKPESK